MASRTDTHRTCEICGIKERQCDGKMFFARFPLEKQRCTEWLRAVGKEDLAYLSIEKLHDLRHVCQIHFLSRDFTKTKTRLKKRAIPKLHLSAPPLTDEILATFLQLNTNAGPVTETFVDQHVPITNTTGAASTAAVTSTSQSTCSFSGTPVVESSVSQYDSKASAASAPAFSTPELDPDVIASTSKSANTTTRICASVKFVAQPLKKRPLATSVIHNLIDPAVPCSSTQGLTSSENEAKRRRVSQADSATNLNPREAELLHQLQQAKTTIRSLKKNAKLIDAIQSPALKEIVNMALKNQKRKPQGRRWTSKYKTSLLAIFKRSPKAYRYLKHLMPLPSINTLQNILRKIPIEPGVCQHALDYLKKQVHKNPQDKYCCLLFDEIAIKSRLIYNNVTDLVEGFTDMGNGERSHELADHALVFMVQGLKRKYKQPIAFFFVKGTVSSSKLATIVREIIVAITNANCDVLGTVCDQGPTNMGALKILKELSLCHEDDMTTRNYFRIDDKTIYIVYDVPHLFKSIRNNFLNYGQMRMDGKSAKWCHLMKVEEKNRSLLYLSKISETHVQPKYRAKMRVKYAAQMLSNIVAAVLKLLALAEKDPNESREMMETAVIIEKLDRLFNFTNGPSGPDDIKKGQRENISTKTDHTRVWLEYRKMLETVTFVKPQTGVRAKNVRCVQGYVTTLCSLRDIWDKCQHLGFKYLNLRQLNQDALENLFGVIRQHSPTNKNPTVASFIAALKTTIITKSTAPHSRGSNCQKDCNLLLTDFHDLVFANEDSSTVEVDDEKENKNLPDAAVSCPVLSIPDVEEEEVNWDNIDMQPIAYLSGYVAHCVLKKHNCDACSDALTTITPDNTNDLYEYIRLREWWPNKMSLTYPSEGMCHYIQQNINVFEKDIMRSIHVLNIRELSTTLFMCNSDASFIKCSVHHDTLVKLICTCLAQLLIRRQCNRINKNISEDEEKIQDLVKKSQQKGIDKNII